MMVGDGWRCSHAQATGRNGLTGGSAWASGRNSSPRGISSIQTGWKSPAPVAFERPWMWRLRTGSVVGVAVGGLHLDCCALNGSAFSLCNCNQEVFAIKLWVWQRLMTLVLRKLPGLSISEPLGVTLAAPELGLKPLPSCIPRTPSRTGFPYWLSSRFP